MVCCCAPGCSNRSDQGFDFVRIPVKRARQKLWLAKIRRDNWTPTIASRLCNVHFEDDQFRPRRPDGRRLLKSDAVPTIFPFMKPRKKRKPPRNRSMSPLRLNYDDHNYSKPANDQSDYQEDFSGSALRALWPSNTIPQGLEVPPLDTSFQCPMECDDVDGNLALGGNDCTSQDASTQVEMDSEVEQKIKMPGHSVQTQTSPMKVDHQVTVLKRTVLSLNNIVNSQGKKLEELKCNSPVANVLLPSKARDEENTGKVREEEKSATAKEEKKTGKVKEWKKAKAREEKKTAKAIEEKKTAKAQEWKNAKANEKKTARAIEEKARDKEDTRAEANEGAKHVLRAELGNGNRWTNEEVKKALQVRFSCGTTGYEVLRSQGYQLPSNSTLQRRTSHLKFDCGVLDEVFEFLKIKLSHMHGFEKHCVLTLDEMAIARGRYYDSKEDAFVGESTLPEHSGEATHALVFMLGGLTTAWKQACGYFFTPNSVDGRVFGKIIDHILQKCKEIGLKVVAIVNDMGPSNVRMWN